MCVCEWLNENGEEEEKGNIPEEELDRSSHYAHFTGRLRLYQIKKKKIMSLSFFLSCILEKPVYCRSTKDLLLMSAYSTITASLLSGYSSSKSRSGSFPFFHPPT